MVLLVCTYLVILASSVYFFFRRKYAFWKELCVPYIKPKLPLGSLKGVGRKYHFCELLKQHYDVLKVKSKKFGFAGFYTFISPTLLVTDLDFVRRVLVDDFEYFQNRGLHLNAEDDPLSVNLMSLDGDKWMSLCKTLIPKFEPKGLEMVLPQMLIVAKQLSATLHNELKSTGQIEISDIIERLTVDMTAICAFKTKCNSLARPNEEFKRMAQASFAKPRFSLLSQLFMLEYPSWADIFHVSYVSEIVTEFFLKLGSGNKRKSNIKESTAEAFTFFSAGFETSTSALAFTLYELALNPELQTKARMSVNDALSKQAEKLSYESIRKMTYLEQCINGKYTIKLHFA
jgi:cytochrome P450 family 6